jgi:hypothetical protein
MNLFWYSYFGLDFTPGNKTAGFELYVSAPVFASFMKIQQHPRFATAVEEHVAKVLGNLGLANRRVGVSYWNNSIAPKSFFVQPMFGSIGCDPEVFERILGMNNDDISHDVVVYTPHNVDDAVSGLALWAATQAWAGLADAYRPR